ncbi:flippase-like domain-containing protein [Flavobacteriaceae bacterium]|nr:flippase-like domain-containing protein [Flavobacteriaceae bacterium]
MLKKLASISKMILPLGIGIFFIYLSYNNTTPEDRENIFLHIKNAEYRFVLLSAVFGALSHISRAYRWKFLLAPLGYRPRLINSVLAVLIGYVSNLGIPRSGELFRATVMDRFENIPFQKGFGTVIAERLVDLVILLCFISLALILQFDLIWDILAKKSINPVQIIIIIVSVVVVFLVLRKFINRSNNPILNKIRLFFAGLWEGIISLKKMEHKWAFIGHTLFIWLMYLAMFYIIKFSIPETASLGLESLIAAFVVGALAISATNGGVGIYPFSVSLVLIAYGISKESSLAFGWIMWTSQTVMVVLFGSLAFFALPLVNRSK